MQLSRFFIQPEKIDAAAGTAVIDDAKQMHQILKVLRLNKGSRLLLLDGKGNLFKCVIDNAKGRHIEVTILDRAKKEEKRPVHVTVALAQIRPNRFEWAIEKLTELGADRIVAMTTERTVAKTEGNRKQGRATTETSGTAARGTAASRKEESRPVESRPVNEQAAIASPDAGKLSRWRAIAREAAEQCERLTIPDVVAPTRFTELAASMGASGIALIAAERREAKTMKECLAGVPPQSPSAVSIFIGPEGGFSESELALAAESNLTFVSLGKRILRSETAAIYALSILASEWQL